MVKLIQEFDPRNNQESGTASGLSSFLRIYS
jgi:hypothetical protein